MITGNCRHRAPQGMFRIQSEENQRQNPEQCQLIGKSRRNLKGYWKCKDQSCRGKPGQYDVTLKAKDEHFQVYLIFLPLQKFRKVQLSSVCSLSQGDICMHGNRSQIVEGWGEEKWGSRVEHTQTTYSQRLASEAEEGLCDLYFSEWWCLEGQG